MGEISMNSMSILFNSNGVLLQHYLYSPIRNQEYRFKKRHFCCCNLHCHMDIIISNRKHAQVVHCKNPDPICDNERLSFGIRKHKMRGMNFQDGFNSRNTKNNFVVVSDIVSNVESEVTFEREVLPPWGNLQVCPEIKIVHRSVTKSSTSTKDPPRIREKKVHYLEERDEQVLSTRILELSRKNKAKSALIMFRSMKASGINPNVHACNSLISCLLRKELLDDALKVFDFMKNKEITTGHTYSLILKAVANAHGCDFALNMFTELETNHIYKKSFDVIVYNTMLSICARADNWVETEKIWRMMKENDVIGSTITYRLLTSIFTRCGQNELALDAYNEMGRNEVQPGEDSMHAMIGACTKEGTWNLSLHVFQDMMKNGFKPNSIACNALINALGKAGMIEHSLEVYKIMKSLGHVPDSYTWNALLSAFYNSNRHSDALQLFDTICKQRSSHLNWHIYNTALMSCEKLRLWEKALQILWKMEDSGLNIQTGSYNLVICACEAAKKPLVALQVYRHMMQQKCDPDTFTHLSLIRACVWGSLWDEINEILNEVEPNASIYNAVIQGMCLRRKFRSAKKLYMKMRKSNFEADGKTRALMLQHLPRDY